MALPVFIRKTRRTDSTLSVGFSSSLSRSFSRSSKHCKEFRGEAFNERV